MGRMVSTVLVPMIIFNQKRDQWEPLHYLGVAYPTTQCRNYTVKTPKEAINDGYWQYAVILSFRVQHSEIKVYNCLLIMTNVDIGNEDFIVQDM